MGLFVVGGSYIYIVIGDCVLADVHAGSYQLREVNSNTSILMVSLQQLKAANRTL